MPLLDRVPFLRALWVNPKLLRFFCANFHALQGFLSFLLLQLLGVEVGFPSNPLLPQFLCVEGLAVGCGSATPCRLW